MLAPANIDALAPDKGNISAEIVNQAFIDPDNAIPESNETNNAASATTTVQSKINLTITKTGPNTASQNTRGRLRHHGDQQRRSMMAARLPSASRSSTRCPSG